MEIILKQATYIDWESLEFFETDLIVEEGKEGTVKMHRGNKPESQDSLILDCSGMVVMKSFAIGHHHVYSALARGMPPPLSTPRNFPEILQNIWWRLDQSLDKETIEASALATSK